MTRGWMALTLICLGACNGGTGEDDDASDAPPEVQAILDLTGDAAAGATLYNENCVGCHPADGSAGTGPGLATSMAETEEHNEFIKIILDGDGIMPPFGDALTDQQIANIWAFLVDEWGS